MAQRFAIRYTPGLRWLLVVLGMGPGVSRVMLNDDTLQIQMGFAFRASIPRTSIASARRRGNIWWAVGVHTDLSFRRWVVNGSPRGMVRVDLNPAGRARLFGISVPARGVFLSLEEPDQFLATLSAPNH